MVQYSVERKESVVRRMLGPEMISISELARQTGISSGTLYNWRNQAKKPGESVTGDSKHPEKWSAGGKLAVVVETFALNEAELAEYCRSRGLFVEQVKA